MNNNLNDKILDKVKTKIAISNFEEKERFSMSKNKILRTAASVFLILGITCGVAYAGYQITNYFKIKGMDDTGIQTALQNNYIQNIDMEYIQAEKVKFKVDYLMMDDVNFDLVFNFVTEDSVDNYEGVAMPNLKITDENNNQIFFNSEDQDIWTKNIGISPYRWSVVEKHDNTLRQVFHISSDNFPKSKKIHVSFDNIFLYNVNKGNPITIEYNDDYKLEFDLSKQLIERETIEYISNTNSKIVENAKLTNSGLAITINVEEYLKVYNMDNNNFKVYDSNGREYTLASNLRKYNIENTSIPEKLVLIFNMTKYDETDAIILKLNDYTIYELIKK